MRIRRFLDSDATELSKLMRATVIKSNSRDYSKEAVQFLVDEYTAEKLIKDSKKIEIFVAYDKSKLFPSV